MWWVLTENRRDKLTFSVPNLCQIAYHIELAQANCENLLVPSLLQILGCEVSSSMRVLLPLAVVSFLGTMIGCSNNSPISDAAPVADLDARRQHIEQQETKVSDEAQARKARSIAVLKGEKVPFIDSLPLIDTESESTRRTTEQVAMRAMALCVVAVKGEGLEQEIIDSLIEEHQLASAFTPKEQAFIKNPKPTEHDRIQFAWRYECYWVMLWALGYIDTLQRPDTICDVPRAVAFFRDNGRDGFIKKAKLRSQAKYWMRLI